MPLQHVKAILKHVHETACLETAFMAFLKSRLLARQALMHGAEVCELLQS